MSRKLPIDFPFIGGVEERIAARVLPADGRALVTAQNIEVNQAGEIAKRHAFVEDAPDGSSVPITNPFLRLARNRNVQCAFTLGKFWLRRLQDGPEWRQKKFHYVTRPRTQDIKGPRDSTTQDDFRVVGRYLTALDGTNFYVLVQGKGYFVYNADTLELRAEGTLTTASATTKYTPTAKILKQPGTDIVCVIYATSSGLSILKFSLNAPSIVIADSAVAALTPPGDPFFDAVVLTDEADAFVIATEDVGASAVATRAFTFSTLASIGAQHLNTLSNNSIGVGIAYTGSSSYLGALFPTVASGVVRVQSLQWTGSGFTEIVAPTVVDTSYPTSTAGASVVGHAYDGSTQARFVYARHENGADRGMVMKGLLVSLTTGALDFGPTLMAYNTTPLSDLVLLDDPSATQPDRFFFLATAGAAEGASQNPILLCFTDVFCSSFQVAGRTLMGRGPPCRSGNLTYLNFLNSERFVALVASVSSALRTGLFDTIYASYGVSLVDWDLSGVGPWVEARSNLFFADGLPSIFDGTNLVEEGFTIYPTHLSGAAGGAGVLTAGTYNCKALYEWFDARGNRYQSAPTPAAHTETSSGSDDFDIDVPTLQHTDKTDVTIVLYRTTSNGTVYYRCNEAANDKTVETVTLSLSSSLPDTLLIDREKMYAQDGELDNIGAPGALSVGVHNNRVFFVGDDNRLHYSKAFASGVGTSFSDGFVIESPPNGGLLTGVLSLGQQLLVTQERALRRLYGQGPNNLGIGSFSELEEIDPTIGVRYGQFPARWSGGVFLPSERGLWVLGAGGGLDHIGERIRSVESTDWLGIFQDRAAQRVFFGHTGGFWVFDHEHDLWYEWPVDNGTDIDENLQAVMPGDSGPIFGNIQSGTLATYAQGATYPSAELKLVTGWFRPGNLTGFSRLTEIRILGEYKASHNVQFSIFYEKGGDESWAQIYSSLTRPYVLRVQPAQQQCSAFYLTIIIGGGATAGAVLHGLSLDVIVKRKHPLGSGFYIPNV